MVAVLGGFEAFPNGLRFELVGYTQPIEPADEPSVFTSFKHAASLRWPRLGVSFADGRKAVGDFPWPPKEAGEPRNPVLTCDFTGGADHASRWRFWLWPLPPSGSLTIAVVWPEKGVSETLVEVDATELIEAAGRAEHAWNVDPA